MSEKWWVVRGILSVREVVGSYGASLVSEKWWVVRGILGVNVAQKSGKIVIERARCY